MLAPGAAACRVAIVQSNYVPWKGYFDLIGSVSKFVLLDSVQFTTRDWRNRNRIKTPHGTQWLTIPVQHKGRRTQPIDGTEVVSSAWAAQHWKTIGQNYSKAPFFDLYRDVLADAYRRAGEEPSLSRVNHILLTAVLGILGIDTPMIPSSDFSLPTGATERLLKLCQLLGATEYVSGPSAQAYLDESRFARSGIGISYADYSGYPEYPQLHGEFEHTVTVLDLLFNVGPEASSYMKGRV
jgi:hypothetical protein